MIVVVHGVGVREAGGVAGQVSAVLSGGVNLPERAEDPTQPHWQAHSTDDFILAESKVFAQNGLLNTFPAHLRRFRRNVPRDGKAVQQERIIADYFWGDISGTGLGGLQVLVGLVKIILGLSHAVRENAAWAYAGDGRFEVWQRRMARGAALLIHGPVVAINLVLFLGVTVTAIWHTLNGRAVAKLPSPSQDGPRSLRELVADPLPELGPMWTELFIGVLALVIGLWLLNKAQVFLLRYLGGSLALTGLGVIVIDACQHFVPHLTVGVMQLVNQYLLDSQSVDHGANTPLVAAGFPVLAVLLVGAMILLWSISILLTWIIMLTAPLRKTKAQRQSLVPQALALMSMAWMMLMTAGWSALLFANWAVNKATGFQLPAGMRPEIVLSCLRLVTPAALMLVTLALVGLYLHFRKTLRFNRDQATAWAYLGDRKGLTEANRLIVGQALLYVLDGFVIIVTAFFVTSVLAGISRDEITSFTALREWNAWLMPRLIFVVGLLTGILVLLGWRGLAAGVAIFTDVLVYLNNYSWISPEGLGPMHDTAGKAATLDNPKRGYWLRHRIHSRMEMLLERLIADEKPDEIVIVSHSQGTVIAIDVICARAGVLRRKNGKTATLKLVTMGSPYTHLYNRYFGHAFADVSARQALQPATKGGELADWINIFRVDDFVGTYVDSQTTRFVTLDGSEGWPREHPVPKNGHTNYWVDEIVGDTLRAFMPFEMSKRE